MLAVAQAAGGDYSCVCLPCPATLTGPSSGVIIPDVCLDFRQEVSASYVSGPIAGTPPTSADFTPPSHCFVAIDFPSEINSVVAFVSPTVSIGAPLVVLVLIPL